jgi:uncharacterized membrane-anchored protein YitT (DUF2179 family)
VYLCDFLILGSQALFSQPEAILYGVAMLVVETMVLDRVMLLGQSQIQILAISEHYEELRRRILTELGAGATMLQLETGYLGKVQKGLLCVIPPRKLHAATALIQALWGTLRLKAEASVMCRSLTWFSASLSFSCFIEKALLI